MRRFFRGLVKFGLFLFAVYIVVFLAQQTGLADSARQSYDLFAQRWSLPSSALLEKNFNDAFSALEATVSDTVSRLSKSAGKAGRVRRSVNTPKTVNRVSKAEIASVSSSSSSSAQRSDYDYRSLKLYEYGRSLLSEGEKACYDRIKKAVVRCDGSLVLPGPLTSAQTSKVLNYYLNDHPEIFYLKKTVEGSSSGSIDVQLGVLYYVSPVTQKVVQMKFAYDGTGAQIDARKKQLEAACGEILSQVNGSMTGQEKLRTLYDAAIKKWSYSYSAVDNPPGHMTAYESYGALVRHSAVCSGYAKALKILLDTAGIHGIVVTGNAYSGSSWGGHAWNAVLLGGSWRYIDATFDDTTESDAYLNKSVSDFLRDHRPYACTRASGYTSNYAAMPLRTK